jgi:tripartite-type tricarboxylate transporter receptor subunit TctC
MAGINIVHVPYKGNGPALIDLIGGQVQLSFVAAPAAIPHVKANRLRALAVTSLQPSVLTPGLPTVASTVPGYESVGISALFAPAKTPAAIVRRLNEETVRYLRTVEAKQMLLANGAEVVGGSPEQLAVVKTEMERLGKVVKEAGIR